MLGAAVRTGALTVLLCVSAGFALAQEEAEVAASPPEAEATAEPNAMSDRDRLWANFSREAAVLGNNRFWVEFRGMKMYTGNDPTLGLNGYSVRSSLTRKKCPNNPPDTACIDNIEGGRFDLIGAYGIGKTAEVGIDIPVVQQQIEFTDGSFQDNASIGDLLLYGKFKRELDEHWAGAVGLEMSIPTASVTNLMGSGDLGLNPFLSTRYQSGRVGVGGHLGFLFNTGSQPQVFNWSVSFLARANRLLALRTEVNGRLFNQYGTNNDIAIWPGFDYNLTDYFLIRPQGLVHATDDAVNWGIGLGLAVTM